MPVSRLLLLARAPSSPSAALRLIRCPRAPPKVRLQSTQSGGGGGEVEKVKRSFRGQLYDSTARRIQAEQSQQSRIRPGQVEERYRGMKLGFLFCESVFCHKSWFIDQFGLFSRDFYLWELCPGSDSILKYLKLFCLRPAASINWGQCLYHHSRQHQPHHYQPSPPRHTFSPKEISKPHGPNSTG